MSETPTPTVTPTPTPYPTAVETHIDLIVIPPNGNFGDVKVAARLLDYNGNPVPNKNVKIYAYDWNLGKEILIGDEATDNDGYVYATYTVTNVDEVDFHAVFEGDSDYAGSEAYAVWISEYVESKIILTASWESQNNAKITARLVDVNGNPLPNRTIHFYANGQGIGDVATDDNGYASITYSVSQNTQFMASFDGDDKYHGSKSDIVFGPSGTLTYIDLAVTPNSPGVVNVVARLLDVNGNPVSGKTISLYVSSDFNSSGNLIGTVTTDDNGYASIAYYADSSYWVFSAKFDGDGSFNASEAYVAWYPQFTSPYIDFVAVPVLSDQGGYSVKLVARLLDYNGNPIPGREIEFYRYDQATNKWPLIGKATTDDNGYASVTYNDTSTQKFDAYFAGDDYYYIAESVIWWVQTSMPMPTPTPTATQQPTPTVTPTPSVTPTATPTPTPTPTPTAIPMPTVTPTPTATPTVTPTPSMTPMAGCQPIVRTGVGFLDGVLLCVGGYGVTVSVLVVAALLAWLLYKWR